MMMTNKFPLDLVTTSLKPTNQNIGKTPEVFEQTNKIMWLQNFGYQCNLQSYDLYLSALIRLEIVGCRALYSMCY